MNEVEVLELVREAVAVDRRAADRAQLRSFLGMKARIAAWFDAAEAEAIATMHETESFVEQAVGDAESITFPKADKLVQRAELLAQLPVFASALADGRIRGTHVDVLVRQLKRLEPAVRPLVLADGERLVEIAARMTADSFARELKRRVQKHVTAEHAQAVYEEQVRSTSLRTWEDKVTGMWCVHAEFDPVSALQIDAAIRGLVESMFRDKTPALAPSDPLMRQQHLAALALKELILNPKAGGPVKANITGVIDLSDGPSEIVWDLPVDIPKGARDALLKHGKIECVIVSNGRVLYAPGKMDEGRDKRTATRAQRRALRALYRGCGMPGCSVPFHRAKIHHILEWENGGLTNLDNLLPLCPRCHHAVHDKGWILELGPNRELTVKLPDGSVLKTGPPSRRRPAA